MTIYFIPTEEVYMRKRVNTGLSWEDLYGSKKCAVCGRPFMPNDAYTLFKETEEGSEYRHVECEVDTK